MCAKCTQTKTQPIPVTINQKSDTHKVVYTYDIICEASVRKFDLHNQDRLE